MDRITIKHLKALAHRLNQITGSPVEPYTRGADGHHRANIGNFHISQAYGGYCLHRMMNEGGGVTCPLGNGHGPARELYEQMRAYIAGFEAALSMASRAQEGK